MKTKIDRIPQQIGRPTFADRVARDNNQQKTALASREGFKSGSDAQAMFDNSQVVTAQRMHIERAFGKAVQRQIPKEEDGAFVLPRTKQSLHSLGDGIIQRYQYLAPDDYLTDEYAEFESQRIGLARHKAGYRQIISKKPPLKVASDQSIAIEHTKSQPKNFYASEKAIEKSNRDLIAAESPIRLMTEPGVIAVPNFMRKTTWRLEDETIPGVSMGEHICNQTASKIAGGVDDLKGKLVLQGFDDTGALGAETIAKMPFHPMASKLNVMLSSFALQENLDSRSLKRNIENRGRREREKRFLIKYDPIIKRGIVEQDAIAYFLPEVAATTNIEDKLFEMILDRYHETKKTVTYLDLMYLIYKAYGTMPEDIRKQRSQQLGLNEYAVPEIGESVSTFTVGDIDYTGKHPDYMKQLRQYADKINQTIDEAQKTFEGVKLADPWTWHFAAPVAKSLDGKDYITLENYNRQQEIKEEIDRVYDNIKVDFTAAKQHIDFFSREEVKDRSKTQQYELYLDMVSNLDQLEDIEVDLLCTIIHANDSFKKIQQQDKGTLWYFGMYGPAEEKVRVRKDEEEVDEEEYEEVFKLEDQSFHRQMVKSGDFANPMTMRLRGRGLSKYKVATHKRQLKSLGFHMQMSIVNEMLSKYRSPEHIAPVLKLAKTGYPLKAGQQR